MTVILNYFFGEVSMFSLDERLKDQRIVIVQFNLRRDTGQGFLTMDINSNNTYLFICFGIQWDTTVCLDEGETASDEIQNLHFQYLDWPFSQCFATDFIYSDEGKAYP